MPEKLAKLAYVPAKIDRCDYDLITVDGKNFYKYPFNNNLTEVDILEVSLIENSHHYNDRAYMPQSVYEHKWWNNLNKTEKDIIKDFSYKE